ncbi:MAG: nucleoside deaminase [Clostridia bacterium]|nr:nucleoside deaminase [Clostridia bacterium]
MKEKFMREALKEAKKAEEKLEVPIGVVIVKDDKIIARAHNLREVKKNAVAHAEILAIQKACKKVDAWRLNECEMYITLEPCPMCAGAILNSRIKKVYIGTLEPRSGAAGSKINLFEDYNYNHVVEYEIGILEEECKGIIQKFFKKLRKKKSNEKSKNTIDNAKNS